MDCDNVSCWIADYLNWLRQRAVTVGRIDRNRIEWRYCDANAALDDDRVGRDNRSGRKWRQKTTFALMSRSVVDQSYRLGSVTDGRPVPVVRRRRVRRTQSLGSGAIRRNGAGSAAEPPPWPRPIDPARDRPFPHSHPAVASEAVVSSAATTNGVRSGPPRIRHRDRVKPVFPRCAKGADSTAGVFTSKCVVTPTRRPYMNNTTAAIDFLFPVVPPPRAGVTRSNLAASMGHVPRNGPIGMRVGSNQGFGHQVSWLAGAHSHTPPRPVEIVDLAAVSRVGNKILGRSTPLNRPDQFDGLATVHRRFLAARPGLNEHASPIATTKMAAARRRCTARSPASSASRAAIDPRRPAPQ